MRARQLRGFLGSPSSAGCIASRRAGGHWDRRAGSVHVGGTGDPIEWGGGWHRRSRAPPEGRGWQGSGVGSRWPLPGGHCLVPRSEGRAPCISARDERKLQALACASEGEPGPGQQVSWLAAASAGASPVSCRFSVWRLVGEEGWLSFQRGLRGVRACCPVLGRPAVRSGTTVALAPAQRWF